MKAGFSLKFIALFIKFAPPITLVVPLFALLNDSFAIDPLFCSFMFLDYFLILYILLPCPTIIDFWTFESILISIWELCKLALFSNFPDFSELKIFSWYEFSNDPYLSKSSVMILSSI